MTQEPSIEHQQTMPEKSLAESVLPDSGAQILPAPKRAGRFDSFIANVRDVSPAWVVNSGSNISLFCKALADGLSVWSSLRKTSRSNWRLAGSGITLASEVVGSFVHEHKIPEERQESYARMSKPQYIWAKTKEAFHPKDNISETAGFALILNGVFIAIAGMKQSSKNTTSWEILQGAMTSVAGMIMTYLPDRERAWQIAHTTFMVRSVPAALQAHRAYYHGYPDKDIAPGDWQQAAKWVANQIANVFGTLYGGVKKLPDGSIDHIGKRGKEVTAPGQSRRMVASRDLEDDAVKTAPDGSPLPLTMISKITPDQRIEPHAAGVAL